MKKEEFLNKLKKNLSVLEEGEVRDIVEEYEQHIDMKMRDGLSEEVAIQDFGDLKELTDGILEAYHVNRNYGNDGKLDLEDLKEESRKATKAIGKGAGVIGRGIGNAGKCGVKGLSRLGGLLAQPFVHLRETLHTSRQKAEGRGIPGRIWLLLLGFFGWLWRGVKGCGMLLWNAGIWFVRFVWKAGIWCLHLLWDMLWLFVCIVTGLGTLCCIFLFGTLVVLLATGYPVVGLLLITIGSCLICCAGMLFSISLIKRKKSEDVSKKDMDEGGFHKEAGQGEWEIPEERDDMHPKVVEAGKRKEVLKHA